MVFFNCNACGEALKKNQVEKHVMRCRNCQSLSCVDCGKDFWGDDYQKHTKCMTEEQKYYGKDYNPKAAKGDAKQEQWTEKLQSALRLPSSNPQVKGLLETLQDYPNIPRKQKAFVNFIGNSLNVRNTAVINQVWDLLSSVTKQETVGLNGHAEEEKNAKQDENNKDTSNGVQECVSNDQSNGEPTLNKRQRKEERRKKQHKSEKKEKCQEDDESKESKISKKRKRNDQDNEDEPVVSDVHLKKKKKKNTNHAEEVEKENGRVQDESETEDQPETVPSKKKKMKFQWESVIVAVLKDKGELTLKKLRKKVLNEYGSQNGSDLDEEHLKAKFNKKVLKIPTVKVSKDRACLKKKCK